MAPSIGYQAAELVFVIFFGHLYDTTFQVVTMHLVGDLYFQIHSIEIQNEIQECISYIWIVLNVSESLVH